MDINEEFNKEMSKLTPEEQWDILSKVSLDILLEGLDDESNFIGEDY